MVLILVLLFAVAIMVAGFMGGVSLSVEVLILGVACAGLWVPVHALRTRGPHRWQIIAMLAGAVVLLGDGTALYVRGS